MEAILYPNNLWDWTFLPVVEHVSAWRPYLIERIQQVFVLYVYETREWSKKSSSWDHRMKLLDSGHLQTMYI